MSFLVRYIATDEKDVVVHDETVVCEVDTLAALTKRVYVLGQPLTLRIEFDPALAPTQPSAEDEGSPPIGGKASA
jgi:hypothetical protein